jgi:hypothetical protein
LLAAGFTRLIHDQCVYVKHDIETNAKKFVVNYVDDKVVTGNSPDEIRKTIDYFATESKKICDLGEISCFIGIDLIRDRAKRTITLSQSPYASQIGAKHSKRDGNTGSKKPQKDPTIPMKPSFDVNAKGNDSNQPMHEEIGRFRYLADHTRPDLLASVSIWAVVQLTLMMSMSKEYALLRSILLHHMMSV